MFARNIGDRILPVTAGGTQLSYSSTVETATGNVYTKIVNTASSAQPLNLNFRGSNATKARIHVLSDPDPDAANTLDDPARVVPYDFLVHGSGGKFSYEVPANSLSAVTIQT